MPVWRPGYHLGHRGHRGRGQKTISRSLAPSPAQERGVCLRHNLTPFHFPRFGGNYRALGCLVHWEHGTGVVPFKAGCDWICARVGFGSRSARDVAATCHAQLLRDQIGPARAIGEVSAILRRCANGEAFGSTGASPYSSANAAVAVNAVVAGAKKRNLGVRTWRNAVKMANCAGHKRNISAWHAVRGRHPTYAFGADPMSPAPLTRRDTGQIAGGVSWFQTPLIGAERGRNRRLSRGCHPPCHRLRC